MGWKTRGKHSYYYRSQGSKKLYFGRGPMAEAAAGRDAAKRELLEEINADSELTRRQFLSADVAVSGFLNFVKTLTGGILVAAGYRRHDRGEWRRRRTELKSGGAR